VISLGGSGTTAPQFTPALAKCKPQEGHIIRQGLDWGQHLWIHISERAGQRIELPTRLLFTDSTLR